MNTNLHNINIERSILSSIIFNPAIYGDIANIISANDFYLPAHKSIFEAMGYLENSDIPIDEEFLAKKLKKENKFDENALLEVLSTSPIPNSSVYAEELHDRFLKREFVALCQKINDAISSDYDNDEIFNLIDKNIFQISNKHQSGEIYDSRKLAENALFELKNRNLHTVGLNTGFTELNKKILGLGKGDLIIIAARPSMGKSAFALNIAEKILDSNKGVVFFSLEMSSSELTNRLISSKTSIPLQKIRTKNLDENEKQRFIDAVNHISEYTFFVDEDKNLDIHSIRSKLRKLKLKKPNIELCIIDYLQLMNTSSKKDRHLEIADISRGLKLLAGELNIPIIALSQLNRTLEARHDKRPMLSDLRESGSLEQDSDIVLFVYRDDVYRKNEEKEKEQKAKLQGKEYRKTFIEKPEEKTEIIIGKNRNGPIGIVNLIFQKACVKFVNDNGFKEPIVITYQ